MKVWLSASDFAMVDALAVSVGVETGALVREAALWAVRDVAREVSGGRVKLRRRSGSGPSPVPAAESSGVAAGGVDRAAAFLRATQGRRS